MITVTNFNQLKKILEEKAIEAMNQGNAVKEVAIRTGKKHVQEDVYDVYTPDAANPNSYQRTEELKNSMKTSPTPNGLELYNDRTDGDRQVAYIVESGDGYEYDFEYNGVPRPFMQNTANELNGNKELNDALKRDLNSMGVRTK